MQKGAQALDQAVRRRKTSSLPAAFYPTLPRPLRSDVEKRERERGKFYTGNVIDQIGMTSSKTAPAPFWLHAFFDGLHFHLFFTLLLPLSSSVSFHQPRPNPIGHVLPPPTTTSPPAPPSANSPLRQTSLRQSAHMIKPTQSSRIKHAYGLWYLVPLAAGLVWLAGLLALIGSWAHAVRPVLISGMSGKRW